MHTFYSVQNALALVAAGEGVTLVPSLALEGLRTEGVDALDIPGLGMRRVALRHLTRSRGASPVAGHRHRPDPRGRGVVLLRGLRGLTQRAGHRWRPLRQATASSGPLRRSLPLPRGACLGVQPDVGLRELRSGSQGEPGATGPPTARWTGTPRSANACRARLDGRLRSGPGGRRGDPRERTPGRPTFRFRSDTDDQCSRQRSVSFPRNPHQSRRRPPTVISPQRRAGRLPLPDPPGFLTITVMLARSGPCAEVPGSRTV